MPGKFALAPQMGNAGKRATFFAVLVLVCASSFNGYFTNSAFRDNSKRFNLPMLLDGSAYRPFVYRQLVPWTANVVVDAIPQSFIEKLVDWLRGIAVLHDRITGPQILADSRLTAKYYFVYYSTFLSFVCAIYFLYRVCWCATGNRTASFGAAFVFALIFPLFMTYGGFFYDHWELLFFALAFLVAMRGNAYWLPILAIPATLNKESFLLFLPVLLPVIRARRGWRVAIASVGSAALVSITLNLIVKAHFAGNPGGVVEWHVGDNLKYLLALRPYRVFDLFYGILLPRGFNLVNVLLIGELVRRSWRQLPAELRQSTLVALIINVPLFILFCFRDELRDLSMLYVPMAIMIAFYVRGRLVDGFERPFAVDRSEPVAHCAD